VNLERLVLVSNRLYGEIPPSLSLFPSLKLLHLSWNKLTGPFPECILSLTSLTHLCLDNNKLSGELPIDLIQLMDLEHLDLSFNDFSGKVPDEYKTFPCMRYIDLRDCNFQQTYPKDILEYRKWQKNELVFAETWYKWIDGTLSQEPWPEAEPEAEPEAGPEAGPEAEPEADGEADGKNGDGDARHFLEVILDQAMDKAVKRRVSEGGPGRKQELGAEPEPGLEQDDKDTKGYKEKKGDDDDKLSTPSHPSEGKNSESQSRGSCEEKIKIGLGLDKVVDVAMENVIRRRTLTPLPSEDKS
jgi:hypothetical protein